MFLTNDQLKAIGLPGGFYYAIQMLPTGFASAVFPPNASLDDVRAVRAEGGTAELAVRYALCKTTERWPDLCANHDLARAMPDNYGLLEQAQEIVKYNS